MCTLFCFDKVSRRRRRGSVTTKKPHQYWCVHGYEEMLNQFSDTSTRMHNAHMLKAFTTLRYYFMGVAQDETCTRYQRWTDNLKKNVKPTQHLLSATCYEQHQRIDDASFRPSELFTKQRGTKKMKEGPHLVKGTKCSDFLAQPIQASMPSDFFQHLVPNWRYTPELLGSPLLPSFTRDHRRCSTFPARV